MTPRPLFIPVLLCSWRLASLSPIFSTLSLGNRALTCRYNFRCKCAVPLDTPASLATLLTDRCETPARDHEDSRSAAEQFRFIVPSSSLTLVLLHISVNRPNPAFHAT